MWHKCIQIFSVSDSHIFIFDAKLHVNVYLKTHLTFVRFAVIVLLEENCSEHQLRQKYHVFKRKTVGSVL